MSRNKEAPQMGFVIKEGKFNIPKLVAELPGGKPVQNLLAKQKLLQERPKRGRVLFQNLFSREPKPQVLETNSWQVKEIDPGTNEKFAGAVLVIPPLKEAGFFRVAKAIFRMTQRLGKKSPVFVVERKGEHQDKETRNKILERAGLVKRDVLTHPQGTGGRENDTILWRGRREKRRPKSKPVNLLAGRLGPWLSKKVWPGVVKESRQAGFRAVSGKEMGDKLRESTIPPIDISNLKLGFGVTVEDSQGQRTRINPHGTVYEEP